MRTPRETSEADIYHVVARGTGRQLIFEDDGDRERFLDLIDKTAEHLTVELLAWCLMGNHVHLLLHGPIESVSMFMKHLCGSYSLWFNRKSGRVGHLFQERFKSEPINSDEYLLTVIRYIHNNPEKAGISSAESYRWSSFKEYSGKPVHCQTEFVLEIFGKAALSTTHDNSAVSCIEAHPLRSAIHTLPDSIALALAQEAAGMPIDRIKALPVKERNAHLRSLKATGLSVRQIERLTGIGRNTVQRA